jgi:hypothetical protein
MDMSMLCKKFYTDQKQLAEHSEVYVKVGKG